MKYQPKDLAKLTLVLFIFGGSIGCKQEPAGVKSNSSASQPRSRRPIVIDESETPPEGNPGTTTTTTMGTTTTTQQSGGGAAAPALAGTYLGACTAAERHYYRLRFTFSGVNTVRLEEEFYNDPGCAAKLEASIFTGTVAVGPANGQGFNIDFARTRTLYYIAPSQNLASFNDPGNLFCGRATGWVHGENVLEAGNICRVSVLDYRVYNLNGTTLMMSARASTPGARNPAITLSFPKQ